LPKPIHSLLVAGVAGGGATVRPLAKKLERAGAKAIVARAPLIRTLSVVREAKKVRAMILKQPEGLTLFGYSMGGLICALVLEEPLIARRVPRLVTYGTPFDGTLVALPGALFDWGLSRHPPDMHPGSALIERVARVINDPHRPWSFAAVNGTGDILAPFPQGNVPARETIEVPHGHTSLLHDEELQNYVTRLILIGG